MPERSPGEGRYAHLEREQRWLLHEVPPNARPRSEIVDRYVRSTRLRLRQVTTQDQVTYKLGQKVRLTATDPERVKLTNLYLNADEYGILGALPAAEIGKSRFVISWGLVELAVDQFHGRLSGLVLAEIELGPDDDLFELPPFALRDVTHDERYSGGALAMATDSDLEALFTETIGRTPADVSSL